MALTHLSLSDFRNFSRLEVEIPSGPLVLIGQNAQGKTSLLEAIFYLASFVSFHAGSDRELIRFSANNEPISVARNVGDYTRGQTGHHLEIRLIQENQPVNGNRRFRREILSDGVKRRAAELVGHFTAVLFLPQMLQVIEGAPDERRRFINLALSQVVPHYAAALTSFARALTQRNALLKQLAERGGDPDQLDYWDKELSQSGARIIQERIVALKELELAAIPILQELTQGNESLRLVYQPSYDPVPGSSGNLALPLNVPVDRSGLTLADIQHGLLERLHHLRRQEIARGVTTVGPHRDELRFLTNGIDAGTYGSRGQERTIMLAMKLAELRWMQAKTGQWPIFLLDEVLAELDQSRRADLQRYLAECDQAILTTTDLNLFSPEFIQRAEVRHIDAGQIHPVDKKQIPSGETIQ